MTMTKTNVGTNPDGSTRWLYQSDGTVVVTGPVTGTVETSDGTTYDVTPDVIEVGSDVHGGEVAHLIAERHEANGHPDHTDAEPFTHLCTEQCGALKRDDDHPVQAAALARVKTQHDGTDDPHAKEQLARLAAPKRGRR